MFLNKYPHSNLQLGRIACIFFYWSLTSATSLLNWAYNSESFSFSPLALLWALRFPLLENSNKHVRARQIGKRQFSSSMYLYNYIPFCDTVDSLFDLWRFKMVIFHHLETIGCQSLQLENNWYMKVLFAICLSLYLIFISFIDLSSFSYLILLNFNDFVKGFVFPDESFNLIHCTPKLTARQICLQNRINPSNYYCSNIMTLQISTNNL